jgi:hypothetical protein
MIPISVISHVESEGGTRKEARERLCSLQRFDPSLPKPRLQPREGLTALSILRHHFSTKKH